MQRDEVEIVKYLAEVNSDRITFSDRGAFSRCYLIDGGKKVFKFKKREDVNYDNERTILKYLKDKSLGVEIQSVGWEDEAGRFLGLFGVTGTSVKDLKLSKSEKTQLANKLANFINEIQKLNPKNVTLNHLNEEIKIWQERFKRSLPILKLHFSESEILRIKNYMTKEMPKELSGLGEKLVFSHGDLWENNIFINKDNKIGIIDFSDSGYYDEAAELMYFEDDELCKMILDGLNADEVLRKKVKIRRLAKAMFIISAYVDKPEEEYIKYIEYIKKW